MNQLDISDDLKMTSYTSETSDLKFEQPYEVTDESDVTVKSIVIIGISICLSVHKSTISHLCLFKYMNILIQLCQKIRNITPPYFYFEFSFNTCFRRTPLFFLCPINSDQKETTVLYCQIFQLTMQYSLLIFDCHIFV